MKYLFTLITLLFAFNAYSYQAIQASPKWLNFNRQPVGFSSMQMISVMNTGTEDIQYLWVNSTGDNMHFRTSTSCGYLRRYSSCTIVVYYQPSAEGNHWLDIRIHGGMASDYVNVNGTAYKPN